MSRGERYPSEGFDGSPFYMGKKRKASRADGTQKDAIHPLAEVNRCNSIDEIVIDDQDSDPELPAKRVQQQSLPRNCILKAKGTFFDFSTDEDVLNLNKAVMAVIDPEGKRKNDTRFQQQSAENIMTKKDEILNEKSKKKGQKTWSYKDLSGDFRMASGSAVVKEVKKVVAPEVERQFSSQGEKYLGNKKIVPNSCNNGVTKKAVLMGMTTDGGGRDKTGLRADPTLKNFDENIINLIECEIMSITTETGWSDVAGLQGAKKALREIVVLPFKRPDIFKGIRAPPKGVLLFGPPGTGKTMIGRCVASQCKATFFNISASSLTSKWVGEGEKLVRALFAVARVKLPSVIFIDEIDSLLSSRSESEHESSRRIKTEFLVQLDGVATNSEERLLVLGATNRPYELDEAARRRFAKRLYIALPEQDARLCIVRNLLDGMDHKLSEQDYAQIGAITNGYSGADMRQLCSEAAMGPIREIDTMEGADIETFPIEKIRPITGHDFVSAARNVRPTVAPEDLTVYKNWDHKFGYCKLD